MKEKVNLNWDNVTNLIKSKNMSLASFSKKCGYSSSWAKNLRLAKAPVTREQFYRMATVLKCEEHEILGDSDKQSDQVLLYNFDRIEQLLKEKKISKEFFSISLGKSKSWFASIKYQNCAVSDMLVIYAMAGILGCNPKELTKEPEIPKVEEKSSFDFTEVEKALDILLRQNQSLTDLIKEQDKKIAKISGALTRLEASLENTVSNTQSVRALLSGQYGMVCTSKKIDELLKELK